MEQAVERYLTVRDVVSRTGFAERTIRQWIASGRLATVRLAGVRAVRVPESAIAALMSKDKPNVVTS